MKVTLFTKWINKELVCCCPVCNKCLKEHGCEELEFFINPYGDINECMKERSYIRGKHGAIRQTR